jgi:hypothetical protein
MPLETENEIVIQLEHFSEWDYNVHSKSYTKGQG